MDNETNKGGNMKSVSLGVVKKEFNDIDGIECTIGKDGIIHCVPVDGEDERFLKRLLNLTAIILRKYSIWVNVKVVDDYPTKRAELRYIHKHPHVILKIPNLKYKSVNFISLFRSIGYDIRVHANNSIIRITVVKVNSINMPVRDVGECIVKKWFEENYNGTYSDAESFVISMIYTRQSFMDVVESVSKTLIHISTIDA